MVELIKMMNYWFSILDPAVDVFSGFSDITDGFGGIMKSLAKILDIFF